MPGKGINGRANMQKFQGNSKKYGGNPFKFTSLVSSTGRVGRGGMWNYIQRRAEPRIPAAEEPTPTEIHLVSSIWEQTGSDLIIINTFSEELEEIVQDTDDFTITVTGDPGGSGSFLPTAAVINPDTGQLYLQLTIGGDPVTNIITNVLVSYTNTNKLLGKNTSIPVESFTNTASTPDSTPPAIVSIIGTPSEIAAGTITIKYDQLLEVGVVPPLTAFEAAECLGADPPACSGTLQAGQQSISLNPSSINIFLNMVEWTTYVTLTFGVSEIWPTDTSYTIAYTKPGTDPLTAVQNSQEAESFLAADVTIATP